ncbi:hypothetical protein TIFTF001_045399 [Ficus carica]|uniref:Uncharacterized protein n=1 Tax=Ficus carica TaxID=3494 RepID=A0AA87YQL9_FICCA|nr:hypothetical protein TIFTF001_045399 [Ficus carica]
MQDPALMAEDRRKQQLVAAMQWVQNLNFALNLVHKAQFPSYGQPRAAGGLRNPVVELVGAWAEWWSSIQPPESFDGVETDPTQVLTMVAFQSARNLTKHKPRK